MSDPLAEHDRAVQRRSTFLVAAIGIIVMVVVAIVILRSQGAEAPAQAAAPASPSLALAHSSSLLDQALDSFRTGQGDWPDQAWADGRRLRMTGGSDSHTVDPGLDLGVQLSWYRGGTDRFAYCLTKDLRALTVVTTSTGTTKHEVAGACPAATLTPRGF